ncbi:hypothetical protein [Lysinibacillus sphaericus]|nr:hypothetical protein [Lysinibacillus sphaericus]MEB7453651.1 hypothetical protein [Lysinibacillus sphaericus]
MIPKVGSPGGAKKGKSGGSKGKSSKKSSKKKSSTKKKQKKSSKKKKKKKRKKKKKKWGKFFTKARKLYNKVSKSKIAKQFKKVVKSAVLATKKAYKQTVSKTKEVYKQTAAKTKEVYQQTKQIVKEVKQTTKEIAIKTKSTAKTVAKEIKNPVVKSFNSFKEIGKDFKDGLDTRKDKALNSPYDFANYLTLGAVDGIWSGAKSRKDKMFNSPSDFLNYATSGLTDMVKGSVNPKDPLSKEHWLDSFGVATSVLGVKGVSSTKPNGVTSGKTNSSSSSSNNKVKSEYTDVFRKNPADPLKEILGPGKQSHYAEWNKIINEIESQGVEIVYKDGVMAYSPSSGKPGQLVIDENSSIGALIHEYTHYLDDKKQGFPGMSYHFQTKNRVKMELNAYMREVEFAEKIGRRDIANMLFENYIQERSLLTNHLK